MLKGYDFLVLLLLWFTVLNSTIRKEWVGHHAVSSTWVKDLCPTQTPHCSVADPSGGPCTPDEEYPQTFSHVSFEVFLNRESFTLTGGSVEDILLTVQTTDLDWNVVLQMWRRITQARRLLRLPRARSVKKTVLKRMIDFDDVTFQEQFRFTKTEFLVILSNMIDCWCACRHFSSRHTWRPQGPASLFFCDQVLWEQQRDTSTLLHQERPGTGSGCPWVHHPGSSVSPSWKEIERRPTMLVRQHTTRSGRPWREECSWLVMCADFCLYFQKTVSMRTTRRW
jgi:hypothetical protein